MATYIQTKPKTCETCRKVFYRVPRTGLRAWQRARFCSIPCRAKQKFSPESRAKMTNSLNAYRSNRKGKRPWNWIEDRTKIKVGDRSMHDPRYKQWHTEVKNRDNWKCRIGNDECNGRLEAHHILSWSAHPELRYEINNGISLCHFHHPRKKSKEIELSPYFQSLITQGL